MTINKSRAFGKKIFECKEELELLANEYFLEAIKDKRPFTLPGLALALGFSSTGTLLDYRKGEGYEEFHEVANIAALRVEQFTAEQCYNKGVNVAGPVFMLKNMGYTDKPGGPDNNVHIKIEGLAAKL
jgi:hypothetical protein